MKKQTIKKLIIIVGIIVFLFAMHMSGIGSYLTLENLQQYKTVLLEYVQKNYAISALTFISLYIFLAAFSIPGAVVATLAGGFLFGAIWGMIYVNIGATMGASLAFMSVRYVFGKHLQDTHKKRLSKFNKELNAHGAFYLIMLRLMPVFPFFIVNIGAALTRISLFTFAWTTSLGIIPGSLVYSFSGRQLGTISSVREIFSGSVIAAFIALACLSMLPILYKRFVAKRYS